MAQSIREKGQLCPIRVRWSEKKDAWIIIAGERRWQATKRAALPTIECYFHEEDLTHSDILEQQRIELELFRPKWQLGSVHVSGEASGQGRLFWREGDRFFGRELTAEQSQTFGELAKTSNSEQAARIEIEPDEQEPFSE